MRLISTDPADLRLKYFMGADPPPYAILSHCWGDSEAEVTLQQFENGTNRDSPGFHKIVQACRIARSQGLDWAWVDTCCIDKTSSAELSEAINSMFAWYQRSAVCYVFLEELDQDIVFENPADNANSQGAASTQSRPSTQTATTESNGRRQLPHTRWFTRGWTLQELVAPNKVVFYDSQLALLGTRDNLADQISALTGIDPQYLCGSQSIRKACIAQKMSWASDRQTTRPEDIAYCLLGLFDLNLPLLYGEGGLKAFRRLQETIIAQSVDDSIFAWRNSDRERCDLFAIHPSEFAGARHVRYTTSGLNDVFYRMTNAGLEIVVTPIFTTTLQALYWYTGLYLRLLPDEVLTYMELQSNQDVRSSTDLQKTHLELHCEELTNSEHDHGAEYIPFIICLRSDEPSYLPQKPRWYRDCISEIPTTSQGLKFVLHDFADEIFDTRHTVLIQHAPAQRLELSIPDRGYNRFRKGVPAISAILSIVFAVFALLLASVQSERSLMLTFPIPGMLTMSALLAPRPGRQITMIIIACGLVLCTVA